MTIPAIVAQHVAAHGAETIFRKKDRGIWKAVTWAELAQRVHQIGAGLRQVGFEAGQVAGVLSQTTPQAAYADLAILSVGGACIAIHPDEEADQLGHILRETQCSVLFVENEEQLDKTLTVRDACPALRQIIIIDMKGLRDFNDPHCISLATCRTGSATEAAPAVIGEQQPAILLFPHGEREGKPRTLSHGDVMHLIASARSMLGLRAGDERLAVLPMSTLMEHVLGLHLALQTRTISNYLESPETAIENLQDVQPTVFGADAEAWSGLHERINRASAGATRVQRALYRWAIDAGEKGGAMAGLARLLVLNAVRRELGLNRLRLAYVCGKAIPADVLAWAKALGISIQRVDGPAPRGANVDARSRALMEEAYGGA
jgi:long-chain acyl-CoA synthetase